MKLKGIYKKVSLKHLTIDKVFKIFVKTMSLYDLLYAEKIMAEIIIIIINL